jgi:hypothetical protein
MDSVAELVVGWLLAELWLLPVLAISAPVLNRPPPPLMMTGSKRARRKSSISGAPLLLEPLLKLAIVCEPLVDVLVDRARVLVLPMLVLLPR